MHSSLMRYEQSSLEHASAPSVHAQVLHQLEPLSAPAQPDGTDWPPVSSHCFWSRRRSAQQPCSMAMVSS